MPSAVTAPDMVKKKVKDEKNEGDEKHMLATYHLFFLGACIILLFVSMLFMFYFEKKRWSMLISFILLGINTVICWVTALGFHGLEFVALDSTNNFQVYTYPDMYGLWVLPYVLFFITIIVAWVGWSKYTRTVALDSGKPKIAKPGKTNPYWK